jgi:hypothetical protein
MTNQKENNTLSLRTIILLVSFLLFAFAASGRSDRESACSSQHPSREASVFVSSSHTDAITASYINIYVSPEISSNILHNSSLNFFNHEYAITGHSRELRQSLKSSVETYLSIKPLPVLRYCYHISSFDSKEELPALS